MFGGLLNIIYTDFPGSRADLDFIQHDNWLLNSAVNTRIAHNRGRWHIWLVMAWCAHPYRFICRCIAHCPALQKAQLYASAYLRTAQKDERGGLKINYDDFNICPN